MLLIAVIGGTCAAVVAPVLASVRLHIEVTMALSVLRHMQTGYT
jgi:hypothetical protein